MSAQALRVIVYRLIEEGTRCNDRDRKRELAERAFVLSQEAELFDLALKDGDEFWRIVLRQRNIVRYRRLLAEGIADETERRIFEGFLRETEARR